MRKIEAKSRETLPVLTMGQLYACINDEKDILVNGSITITDKEKEDVKSVTMHANICDKDGKILYVLDDCRNFKIMLNAYYSFSLYLADSSRFLNVEDLAYVELYATFGNANCC